MKTINFIVAANNTGSITRLVAEYSNHLIAKGFDVIVSYPIVSHFDYCQFVAQRKIKKMDSNIQKALYYYGTLLALFIKSIILKIISKDYRAGWIGKNIYPLNKKIKFNCFLYKPTAKNMPNADYIIVMQEYLIPHLLYLPEKDKGKIIGSIHLDYSDGINDSNKLTRNWWEFIVSLDQKLNVPLWATSRRSKNFCDTAGIKIGNLIYNGINIDKLIDGNRRGKVNPLRIMLYCDVKPQKGLKFGCAVIKQLRKDLTNSNVEFYSLGSLDGEQHQLFDNNLGYLKEAEYIKAYQESDIFIFPSQYEGFPAPPLDAMACGCALATTCVQGVEEYGIHKKNCMLCQPNDLEGMLKNIKILIENVELRDKIREQGIITANKFSWENSTDKLIEFITNESFKDS